MVDKAAMAALSDRLLRLLPVAMAVMAAMAALAEPEAREGTPFRVLAAAVQAVPE